MLRGGGSDGGGASAGVVATSGSKSNDTANSSPAIDGGAAASAGGLAISGGSGTAWGAGEEMKLGGRNVLARTESGGRGKGDRMTAGGGAVGKMSAERQAVTWPKKSESPTALATYSWGMESRKGGVRETFTATIGDAEMVKARQTSSRLCRNATLLLLCVICVLPQSAPRRRCLGFEAFSSAKNLTIFTS